MNTYRQPLLSFVYLNKNCQAIYPAAQVCVTTGNIYTVGTGEVGRHDFRIRSTVSTYLYLHHYKYLLPHQQYEQ